MCSSVLQSVLYSVGLAGGVTGQTIRTWSGNSNQRWDQYGNWTASNVSADSGRISISSGAALRLNDLTDTYIRVSDSGVIDFGPAESGRLALGVGNSNFSGSFLGSGELVFGAEATLTLGADINNANLNLTLAGGTRRRAGHGLIVGELRVTGSSTINIAEGADSILTVENWADAADCFYSQTGYSQGGTPLNQVAFEG